jgi:hypothetical protein
MVVNRTTSTSGTAEGHEGSDRPAAMPSKDEGFDWVSLFSPRADVEAATMSPVLTRGSRGRRRLSI